MISFTINKMKPGHGLLYHTAGQVIHICSSALSYLHIKTAIMKLFTRSKKISRGQNNLSALFSSAIAEGVKETFAQVKFFPSKASPQNLADSVSELEKIANCLANNFAKSLYCFSTERNYYVYAGCLHEINDWAGEFYEEYYLNSDYTPTWDEDFLIEWGHERMQQFIDQRTHKKAQPVLSI